MAADFADVAVQGRTAMCEFREALLALAVTGFQEQVLLGRLGPAD